MIITELMDTVTALMRLDKPLAPEGEVDKTNFNANYAEFGKHTKKYGYYQFMLYKSVSPV
ncbi:hypothetical protein CSA57_04600 [candidate division KSB3 bacterium]|nr:MAG: hypothetical protein CSA57_04600 [candidate division KSB3 bacterium]